MSAWAVVPILFQSSLLQSILGELSPHTGSVRYGGKLAYVPQQPWVFSSTLRRNVLFGEEFDSQRYYKAIRAAVLEKVGIEYTIYIYKHLYKWLFSF